MNIISVVSLLAFAGITAWETQRMKESYSPHASAEANSRMGWASALNLYMSFIAMFQSVLRLMAVLRGE
jgi:FtsH-binding integral membrane protein